MALRLLVPVQSCDVSNLCLSLALGKASGARQRTILSKQAARTRMSVKSMAENTSPRVWWGEVASFRLKSISSDSEAGGPPSESQ